MSELVVLDAEPLGEDIVERLETVLAMAHRGELSSVAIAWVDRGGSSSSAWSKAPSMPLLLGAIGRLAHRYNRWIDDK